MKSLCHDFWETFTSYRTSTHHHIITSSHHQRCPRYTKWSHYVTTFERRLLHIVHQHIITSSHHPIIKGVLDTRNEVTMSRLLRDVYFISYIRYTYISTHSDFWETFTSYRNIQDTFISTQSKGMHSFIQYTYIRTHLYTFKGPAHAYSTPTLVH